MHKLFILLKNFTIDNLGIICQMTKLISITPDQLNRLVINDDKLFYIRKYFDNLKNRNIKYSINIK